MSSYGDFVSRILRRTSSVGFLAVIGVGQSALGPQWNRAQRGDSLSSEGKAPRERMSAGFKEVGTYRHSTDSVSS